MTCTRNVVLSALIVSSAAFSAPLRAQGAVPPKGLAGAVGRFMVVPVNYEYRDTKLSAVMRIDTQTGQTWIMYVGHRPVPQGQVTQQTVEWVDMAESGTRPKP